MTTRNERRRRVRERERLAAQQESTHTGRMMARVVKADSKQLSRPGDDGFVDLYTQDRAIPPPLPLENLWTIYEENAIHSACIDAKVADSVGRGWQLAMDEDELDEDAQRAQTQTVERKLRDLVRPSGVQGGFSALCRQLAREYDATGWGAWEISRGKGGEIDGIFPVPPHTLRAVKNNRDLYVQVRNEKKVYFKRFGADGNYTASKGEPTSEKTGDDVANEVVVLKQYTPRSPYYGIPKWVSGVPAVAEFTAIREYNVSWFESGGTGDRSVHVKADDEGVAAGIADSMEEKLRESRGIGHTTLITHGTSDTEVAVENMSPETGKRDGQFGNRRHDLVQELLIAHQVPSYRIGWAIVGELGGEAADEMIDSYRYGVVEEIQEAIEELLADTIFNTELGGIDLGGYAFEFKDLDWTQMAEEIEKAGALKAAGAITLNEMRVMLGQERGDDPRLDEYYMGTVRLGTTATSDPAGAQSATDVIENFAKALEAAVRFEKDGSVAFGATDTDDEPQRDPDDQVEASGGKRRRRRGGDGGGGGY